MIIEKKTTGILIVPVLTGGDDIQLMGGMNEVDNKLWGDVRDSVMPHPHLKEHHVDRIEEEKKVEKKVIKNKDGSEEIKETEKTFFKISAKAFKKLNAEKALPIVEKTYSLDLLNRWKKTISKESVRIAVMEQIEKVEKRKAKQKNKKEED